MDFAMVYNKTNGGDIMQINLSEVNSPLFEGIQAEERNSMLSCIGYYVATFRKGNIIAFEDENIRNVGIVLSGSVDMVKEDVWGNKVLVARMGKNEIFGESFAWGKNKISAVTFVVSTDAKILMIPLDRVMHSCANTCVCHRQLVENMVHIIADKNRDLIWKIEVISKRTIREKLLAYLSSQAQTQNSRYFEIPLGRTELAEYLCVDRSALTRELVKMRDDGLIDYDKNCFRILEQ